MRSNVNLDLTRYYLAMLRRDQYVAWVKNWTWHVSKLQKIGLDSFWSALQPAGLGPPNLDLTGHERAPHERSWKPRNLGPKNQELVGPWRPPRRLSWCLKFGSDRPSSVPQSAGPGQNKLKKLKTSTTPSCGGPLRVQIYQKILKYYAWRLSSLFFSHRKITFLKYKICFIFFSHIEPTCQISVFIVKLVTKQTRPTYTIHIHNIQHTTYMACLVTSFIMKTLMCKRSA